MKQILQKMKQYALFVLLVLMSNYGWGQTYYNMSGGNYSCDFADIANWTDNFASGVGANNWRVASTVATSSVNTTTVFASGVSGGVQKGTETLILVATSTNSSATDLLINMSGRTNGKISLDWSKVTNTVNASPRSSDLKIQYSINNGVSFADLTGYTLPRVLNNITEQSGSLTEVPLPAAVDGVSQVVIRFYVWNNSQTGGSGNRPKISIDNITVTSTSTSGAPSISSPTATSISNSSAVLGANITSDGGSSITNRGTIFKTSSPVTISDNYLSEGGSSTGGFTHTRSSLTPQTLYYYAGYATNSSGTTLSSESSFRTLSNPPTVQATNLAGVLTSNTAVDLSWTAATFPSSGATTKGYVLLRATAPNTPSLSNTNGVAPVAGANTTIVLSTITESTTSQTNTGLTTNTTYNYLLIPYTWDGTNVSTYNYLFASAPTAVVNTPSNLSDVVAVSSSESITISSLMNDAAPLTSSTGVQVWQFTVRDGGSTLNDSDNLPTIVSGFTLTQNNGNAIDNWLDAIKTVALFDGTTLIATPTSITATTIVFSGLNLSVTDNSSKTYSLRLSLNETLNNAGSGNLDNDDFVFSITNANFSSVTDGTSSTKASFSTASSTNGQNAISVVASKLLFVQQPTNVSTNTSITPSVTVRAVDNGNNIDRDFVSSVSITATGSILIASPVTVSSAIGLATFSGLQFSTPATGVVLQANATGLTGVISLSFDVTLPLSAYTYRTIRSGNWNQIISGSETWERSSDGTNWFPVSNSDDIPNNSAGSITIRNGHIVQVNVATNVDELLVETNAQITIQSAQTLTIIDGTGTDATISGFIKNDGTFTNNGQIIFNASSTYEHNNNIASSFIPLASWSPASNLLISGVVSNFPSFNSSQTYGNVTWNCQNQSGTLNLVGNLRNIAGNFIIQSTGTGILRLTSGNSTTFTIGGNLEISNSSQLQIANAPSSGTPTYVLNIGGNFSQTGGVFNPNTGAYNCIINFTGDQKTFTQSGGTLTNTLINWTIADGASLTLNNNLPVATNRLLIVGGGTSGTLDCGANPVSGAGSFTLTSGATLKTASTLGVNGSITVTGTKTFSSATNYEFNGSSVQFTGSLLPATVNNLTINNASGVALSQSIAVAGTLGLTLGKLNLDANTLTINGSVTGSGTLSGGATSNLTITSTSGTINFDQTTPGTTNVLKNLTITGSGTTTLANALNITAGSSSGVVTVGTGATLNTGGFLTFKSDANGTASFGNSAGTITGNVTVERYIPARRAFRFLSPSVTTSTSIKLNWQENAGTTAGLGTHITGVDGITNGFDATSTNNPSLFTFNNSTGSWVAVTSTLLPNTLTAGTPYRLMVRGDRSIDMSTNSPSPTPTVLRATGTLHTGNFPTTLNQAAQGFSFIGNPYQAPLDIKTALQSSTDVNKNVVYYWDPTINDRGGYITRNLQTSQNIPNNTAVNDYVQPGQAFFVVNEPTLTSTPALTFTENHKSVVNAAAGVFRTANTSAYGLLRVNLQANTNNQWQTIEGTLALFNDNYSWNVTSEDATKMTNLDEEVSFVQNNTSLAIALQNNPSATSELPIKIGKMRHTNYQWQFELDNYDGATPYLFDTLNNSYTQINNGTVVPFTADANTTNRFKIVFQNAVLSNATFQNTLAIYPNPAKAGASFYVEGISEATVTVSNLLGQTVPVQTKSQGTTLQVTPNTSLSQGVYLVNITTQGTTQQVKWIVE